MAGDEDRLTGPELPQDFADLIACLNEAAVEYMHVGGWFSIWQGTIRR